MTPAQATGRTTRRSLLLVLVVTVLVGLVALAAATGLLGSSDGDDRGGRTAAVSTPAPSAAPSPTPSPTDAPSPSTAEAAAPVMRAAAAPLPRSAPVRLRIPSLDVDSTLMDLGLEDDGALETPPGAFPAGWYTGAPTPGEIGPAIVVGHVRYETPGVFARLTELRRGQSILVEREDGTTAQFQVVRLAHFAKSAFPTETVYGDIDHAGLRLITCGGLDADTDEFDENVVVFARLVQP